jgi:hypothetical protein|tara:strand:+ start:142 stop:261 length:120 start_codon:yes stop_codon:yes gene_type:complete
MDGEQVVGSLMGGWDGCRGEMARLAVHPDSAIGRYHKDL